MALAKGFALKPDRDWDPSAGAVQPVTQGYGFLLATDRGFQRIEAASSNIRQLEGFGASELLGSDVAAVFGATELHRIRNILGRRSVGYRREILPQKLIGGTIYRVLLHVNGGRAIIELLPDDETPDLTEGAIQEVYDLFTASLATTDATGFLTGAVEHLRAILDYDRITVLKSDAEQGWYGMAEARNSYLPSLLGPKAVPHAPPEPSHWQPRVIVDGGAEDVALIGARTVDLSLAILRGKSAKDRQYMKTLEIGAAFDIPLIVEDGLWGVIACHSRRPLPPGAATLVTADLAGQIISLRLRHAIETGQREDRIAELTRTIHAIARSPDGNGAGPRDIARRALGTATYSIEGKRVLVVEGSAVLAGMIRRRLMDMGCSAIDIVHSVDQALGAIECREYDICLAAAGLVAATDNLLWTEAKLGALPIAVTAGLGYDVEELASRLSAPVIAVPFEEKDLQDIAGRLLGDR